MNNYFDEPILITRPLLPATYNISRKIGEIWDSKWLTNNGSQHQALEIQLKNYLNVDQLSLFSNGTLALLLGLKALDLTGDVITTPFTFPATVQALDWNGLTPVFCDIDPRTLTIDATKIEALITDKTSAILAVHVFGNPCDVEAIQAIADRHQLKVIYDGAHVFGAKINGKPISHYGDMTMLSFHATKLFNTIEGGALAFKAEALARKLDLLKNFGLANPEEVLLSGLNAKMNEIQAAMGLEVLKLVDEERAKRHILKKTYEQHLALLPGIRVLTTLEEDSSSYQYFVIEIDESRFGKSRDWLHEQLKDYNVFTRKYFYPLCSDFHWYRHLESTQRENLSQAQKSVGQVLAMPFYGELGISSVIKICEIIEELHISHKKWSDVV
ncbi:DegT/DnrJ/EryC1/StrS family aminotransferase [Sporosarcina sp. E16_8]|uniref:DegT/DnrJ/EryC1/StrS family aminotransferase n=1 Tax=Sporosarcina sp. E16_8 TaxID=2789295 RepID=UPI001A91057D|nr:DegT/DnrJ/EryC1/StrS family aminotransferase [Sporosarcina sp. E16_8]MBO0588606.1 DegT/DnrJ/EryC1/StrS family aminotransferase [Sporosarcina sp. E16_8]